MKRENFVTADDEKIDEKVIETAEEETAVKKIVSPLIELKCIYIEVHESEVPWLKIFTKVPKKEFSHCNAEEKNAIFHALDLIEKLLLEYYQPEKINIASFGNMLPHVHWHIMARFKEDSYFPEPMWGEKQRDSHLDLPSSKIFISRLKHRFVEEK